MLHGTEPRILVSKKCASAFDFLTLVLQRLFKPTQMCMQNLGRVMGFCEHLSKYINGMRHKYILNSYF